MSTHAPTTLTLAGGSADEVVIDAPSNSNLALAGATDDVDLVGVHDLTCTSGFHETGGADITGQCMNFCAGRTTATATQYASLGGASGTGTSNGLAMLLDGEILEWALRASTAITATFELYKNGAATGVTISLAAATENSAVLNYPFSQLDDFTVQCTSGPGTTGYCINIFFQFHA